MNFGSRLAGTGYLMKMTGEGNIISTIKDVNSRPTSRVLGGGCECRTLTFKHFRLRSNITNERIKTSGGGAAGPIRNPDE